MKNKFYAGKARGAKAATRGFTLMELLVVTGIMVIITAVMLANHSAFGGAITLRNLAYDIALSLREAQTFGISVRQFDGTFAAGYGIHVRLSSPTTYVLFADGVTQNNVYDEGEVVQSTEIGRGFSIADICITPAASSIETCNIQRIDVLFRRPEPDAHIRYNVNSTAQRARIILQSPRGDRRSVIVESAGQISVQ